MARRAPGWYQDPGDPAQLRHWSGRGWSGRRRSWPAWDVSAAEVVPDKAWGGLGGAHHGPLLDGPVRPAPLPATGRGALAEHEGARTHRLVRPAGVAGGHAGFAGPPIGTGFDAAPAWMPSRRPLMVFCALVGVAVMMMAVTIVGVGGRNGIASSAVGRDGEFLARASSVCDAGLAPLRSSGSTMAAPGATATLAADARRAANAVASVEQQLRGLPMAPDAAGAITGWLDGLRRYVTDQNRLAGILTASPGGVQAGGAQGTAGAPTAGAPASGGDAGHTAAELAAMSVTADIHVADFFAGSNGLSACSLQPSANASPLVTIP